MVVRFSAQVAALRDSQVSSIVRGAMRYIDDHLSDRLRVGEIACQVYVHPDYLSVRFKQETGEGISRYIQRRRVQEEYREVVERIAFLQDLLSSEDKLRAVVRDEVLELKRTHGDVRRTSVRDLDVSTSVSAEDLVSNTDVALLLTTEGRVRLSPAGKDGGGLAQLLTAGGAPIAMAQPPCCARQPSSTTCAQAAPYSTRS